MQVRLFGQLEAEQAGVLVAVRGAKQRALLALLALRTGQPVRADRLIDVLWADGHASHPANALQAQIGQLRRAVPPVARQGHRLPGPARRADDGTAGRRVPAAGGARHR